MTPPLRESTTVAIVGGGVSGGVPRVRHLVPVAVGLDLHHLGLRVQHARQHPPRRVSVTERRVVVRARMVDDLQTMAAADAAVLRLTRERTDLADIAGAAADSLARRFEAAEVELDRQLGAAPVLADERWLHQVVTNLLGNALKSTPAGGTVTIRARQRGVQAILEVADTGVGIPAGELPHIFDGFWRGQAAAQTSGSGIGLAIAAELAVAHGGTLTADSQPGHGATFTLALPLA